MVRCQAMGPKDPGRYITLARYVAESLGVWHVWVPTIVPLVEWPSGTTTSGFTPLLQQEQFVLFKDSLETAEEDKRRERYSLTAYRLCRKGWQAACRSVGRSHSRTVSFSQLFCPAPKKLP